MVRIRSWNIEMPRLLGLVAPIVALVAIFVAIAISPWFDWVTNALSDLGNYDNGIPAAVVFNSGLICAGAMELIFVRWFLSQLKDPISRVAMIALGVASIFLILIGILSENAGRIHFWVSVGFFLSFPISMWIMSVSLLRRGELRWLGVVSFALPFFSLYMWWATFAAASFWTGMAIPEIATASTLIVWLWTVWYLHYRRQLSIASQ
ncbi:MAG: DUF998 domain-containing protein [Candidatus Thorarchaeota archaeon]